MAHYGRSSQRLLSLFPWNLIWALLRVFTRSGGGELLLNTWPRLVPDQRKCAASFRRLGVKHTPDSTDECLESSQE